jgi:hypothetical protein
MNNSRFFVLLLVCISILGFASFIYFSHFNNGYSVNSSEWRDFATFMSLFVAIINMILMGSIAYTTSKTTAWFQKRQLRPHIYIIEAKNSNRDFEFTSRIWQMINSSSVTANNVLVRYKFSRNDSDWLRWVNCFSVGSKDKLDLTWIHYADIIEICYSDIETATFFKYSMMDWIGKEIKIKKDEFEINLKEASSTDNIKGYPITYKHAEEDLAFFVAALGGFSKSEKLTKIGDFLRQYLRRASS